MGRSDRGAAAEFAFDHGAETVIAEGALLLDVCADVADFTIGENFIEQGTIGKLAFGGLAAERQICQV
jgi:hypothetical protein